MEKQNKGQKVYGLAVKDKEKYLKIRKELEKNKQTLLTTQFDELNGIINITKFSRRYFGKGHAWFSQKLNNCLVLERKRQFTQEEIQTISNAYKDLAQQLIDYSEELERAKDIDEN